MFSPYDDLPLPSYLDDYCYKDFENRCSLSRLCVTPDHIASLSKHEILFGLVKGSKNWHAGVLQIVHLTLIICAAWCIVSLLSEFGAIMNLLGDAATSNQKIPILLIMPIIQINMLVGIYKISSDWLPASLKSFSMATSTEMMKDRTAIN